MRQRVVTNAATLRRHPLPVSDVLMARSLPFPGMVPRPEPVYEPWTDWVEHPPEAMIARAAAFRDDLRRRRTVRQFSDRPVPRQVIAACIEAAGTAPNGANLQPWHFAVVGSAEKKREIRLAAEQEERAFYSGRAPQAWLDALAHLGTDEHKPYLETAPWLIAVFAERYGVGPEGEKQKRYYVDESVGIAVGMLVTALHHAGLATLTHTPSPMGFLADLLQRPVNERAYVLVVAGYPAAQVEVPRIEKKGLDALASWW